MEKDGKDLVALAKLFTMYKIGTLFHFIFSNKTKKKSFNTLI